MKEFGKVGYHKYVDFVTTMKDIFQNDFHGCNNL
jgi:hypothetical protein